MRYFLLGAIGYPALELLYRQRTHLSMSLAGGLSVLLISQMQRLPLNNLLKAVLCGVGITGIELLCGSIWNRSYAVWDYRQTPLNFRGQVCLPFSLVWCALSYGVLMAMDYLQLAVPMK